MICLPPWSPVNTSNFKTACREEHRTRPTVVDIWNNHFSAFLPCSAIDARKCTVRWGWSHIKKNGPPDKSSLRCFPANLSEVDCPSLQSELMRISTSSSVIVSLSSSARFPRTISKGSSPANLAVFRTALTKFWSPPREGFASGCQSDWNLQPRE